MTRAYFDLESDGLHFDFTRIHCISIALNDGEPKLYVNRRDAHRLQVKYAGCAAGVRAEPTLSIPSRWSGYLINTHS